VDLIKTIRAVKFPTTPAVNMRAVTSGDKEDVVASFTVVLLKPMVDGEELVSSIV
jgi:hypothetical protein